MDDPVHFSSLRPLRATHLAKNLIAISGRTAKLNRKSEKANEITKGVVTCFRSGVWFNKAKMVTRLKVMPRNEQTVAELPASIESMSEKTNSISDPFSSMQWANSSLSIVMLSFHMFVLENADKHYCYTDFPLHACRKLMDGLRCIDDFTLRCLDREHRAYFNTLYAGTTQVIVDLCQEGTYQSGLLAMYSLIRKKYLIRQAFRMPLNMRISIFRFV